MCMIALAWQVDARWPVLLIANRDEYHARPALPLAPVDTVAGLLAGTDVSGGGHWLGVLPDGRFAAVTNARIGLASARAPAPRSRGALIGWALQSSDPQSEPPGGPDSYGPYGLLRVDAAGRLHHHSNVFSPAGELSPGLHVLSNGPMNADWPKAVRARAALRNWLEGAADAPDALLVALADRQLAADPELPDTGVGLALERRLSPLFINDPVYGTRCSTVLAVAADGAVQVIERRYGAEGQPLGESRYQANGGALATPAGWRHN